MVDYIAVFIHRLPPLPRILTVLTGAVLIHLTIGTYHTFGNMLPYMASYMRNYTDPTVRIEQLMWIPTFQGCFPFSMVVGGWLVLRIGPRSTAFLGCLLTTSAVALSSVSIRHSFCLFFLTYGLMFGLGMGIAYVTAVVTVINWAPDKVGLVSGVVAAGFGVSSSIFAPIQTALVNPNNLPATHDGYFVQPELLERVPGVFISLAWIYGAMQLLGLIVLCDPPEKMRCSGLGSLSEYWSALRPGRRAVAARFGRVIYRPLRTTEETTLHPIEEESPILPRRRSASRESTRSDDSDDVFVDPCHRITDDRFMHPSEMLRSPTFYFLFAALFCCSFYANMFYNLYKTFAETFIEDDFFLAMAFSLGSVANAVARIGWGYLTDKTSFQISVSTATCIATALLLTMPMTRQFGELMYLIWLCGTFVCMGATHALFITATVRCFGSKYKATNYGFLTFSTTCSGVLLSIISQFYLESIGYTWLFMLTAAFPFTAFLITSAIQRTPQGCYITN